MEAIPDPELSPEELAERSDLYCSLHEAIASLPPKLRTIVLLHSFRQLTFTEIACVLDMPASTVKTYFYRSLPHLRRALAGEAHLASFS
jgi:RNA polymerase sigma-70 factor (ECF subfamily)